MQFFAKNGTYQKINTSISLQNRIFLLPKKTWVCPGFLGLPYPHNGGTQM